MISKPDCALIIVGHGSTINADSSAPTYAHAIEIQRRGCFGEVCCAFWKEEPSLRQVLYMIESDNIYVVPNFISEGYFTRTVIPRELELTGDITIRDARQIRYCDPVGSDARMTSVLLHRAAETAPQVPRNKTSLVIVGHGTTLNENSGAAVRQQVQRIRHESDYAEVLGAYMEEAPLISDWHNLTTQPHVVVVPFFIADGLHSYEDIPVLLGLKPQNSVAASKGAVFRLNPHRLEGRDLYYASSIGTEPMFADVILDQVEAFDRRHAGVALVA